MARLYQVQNSLSAVTDCLDEILKYLQYMQNEVIQMKSSGNNLDTDEIIEYAANATDDELKYLENLLEEIYRIAEKIDDCAH